MKKEIYKYWWCLVFIVLICIGGVSCGDGVQKDLLEKLESVSVGSEPVATEPHIPENRSIEYDALQQVFLALSNDTTIEDLYSLIADNDLEYTSQDYNGTPKKTAFKLAYSPDTALQKYAETGDHIKVDFDKQTGHFCMQSTLTRMLLRLHYIIIMAHIGLLQKKKQTMSILGIIINPERRMEELLSIITEIKLKKVITSVLTVKKLSKMLLLNNQA